jgi:hypothetical protein
MSAALNLRAGLGNVQIATAKVHSVQSGDGSFSLPRIGHLHERKTSRSARITIRHQADTFHGPVLLKKRADGIFSCAEVQVANKNLFHVISSYLKAGTTRHSLGQVLRGNQIRLYDSRFWDAVPAQIRKFQAIPGDLSTVTCAA